MKAMPEWELLRELFHRVRGLIFHTQFEMKLGQELYSLTKSQSYLFGEGIDTEDPIRSPKGFA